MMQVGQLVDFCVECVNREKRAYRKAGKNEEGAGSVRKATQADIDNFFG